MFKLIKKQLIFFFLSFFFSFIICFFYPVKKEFYLGIKGFFYNKTFVNLNSIVTVNYKRALNNDKEFIVSGYNPVLIINFDNRYIKDIELNFKEQLKENLKPIIYIEKNNVNIDDDIIKITNIETLKENISYSAKINAFLNKLVFIVGRQVGDNFIVDNIIYSENYKYYFNKIFNYNYLKLLNTKKYWLNILKLLSFFMLVFEYFIIRNFIIFINLCII